MATFVFVFFLLSCAATPQKRSLGQVMDDSFLTMQLKSKFVRDKTVPAGAVSVKIRHGVVTLTGEVNDQKAINRAVELSEMQKGVKEVRAYLVLKEFGQLQKKGASADNRSFFKTLFSNDRSKGSESITKGLQEKDLLEKETVHDNDNME